MPRPVIPAYDPTRGVTVLVSSRASDEWRPWVVDTSEPGRGEVWGREWARRHIAHLNEVWADSPRYEPYVLIEDFPAVPAEVAGG